MQRVVSTIHVGRLLCGPVRNGFEQIKFRFPDEFDYKEGSGFLSRDFNISSSRRIWDSVVVPCLNVLNERFKD